MNDEEILALSLKHIPPYESTDDQVVSFARALLSAAEHVPAAQCCNCGQTVDPKCACSRGRSLAMALAASTPSPTSRASFEAWAMDFYGCEREHVDHFAGVDGYVIWQASRGAEPIDDAIDEPMQSDAAPAKQCECLSCITDRMDPRFAIFAKFHTQMTACATCGNGRCPHANNHRYACTGSNEPGQHGSRYP